MEVYGNLIYNNGWDGATDRGHGHGIYTQNQTGTKNFTDNIVFNNYGEGMQIFGSDVAYLDNVNLAGNTIFSNGSSSKFGSSRNLLFGGGRVANNGKLLNNYTYYPVGATTSSGVDIGYSPSAGVSNFVIQDNFFVSMGDNAALFVGTITNLTMTGNKFYQDVSGVSEAAYPSNTYYRTTRPTGT